MFFGGVACQLEIRLMSIKKELALFLYVRVSLLPFCGSVVVFFRLVRPCKQNLWCTLFLSFFFSFPVIVNCCLRRWLGI